MSDLIKREDAIKAVWKPQVKPNELIFDALKTAIESEINNVPSADRPQGWIPCSERLPKQKRAKYLICTDDGYVCACRWTNDIYGLGAADEWSTWGWNHADVPQFSKVVAWMDLKPWKGADDETTD